METITVFNVADWFLGREKMTPKKLQKLVYYAYSWALVLMNERLDDEYDKLFDSRIEAWVHGPVFPELYHKYKSYGWSQIPKTSVPPVFNEDVEDVLQQVWDVYGAFNGNELESISHQEEPWILARNGCSVFDACCTEITDTSIYDYYSQRLES